MFQVRVSSAVFKYSFQGKSGPICVPKPGNQNFFGQATFIDHKRGRGFESVQFVAFLRGGPGHVTDVLLKFCWGKVFLLPLAPTSKNAHEHI